MNSGGQPSAPNVARLLATQSAQSGRNVVLCDATGQAEREIKEQTTTHDSAFPIYKINDNLSAITGANGSSFFTSKTFDTTIRSLAEGFDQVFICMSTKSAQLGLIALQEFTPGLVINSSLRKTKKSDINKIKLRQPIDLLFHD